MRNWIIYSAKNLVTGERYIGKTKQGLARRKGEHMYRFRLGERTHRLYDAMREYGAENFKFEALCSCLTDEALNEMERHFMSKYDTIENGYNMYDADGGVGEETKQKLSRIHTGRKVPWVHKGVATRRARGTDSHPMPKGAKSPRAKRFLVRKPDGSEIIVHGLNAFCKENGLDKSTMLAVLAGKQRHHKGYALLARFNDQGDSP